MALATPRPPFLTEFVNQIGKLTLVELVYHLFGGRLRLRIHSHVERSVRLKTKAARGISKLKTAYAQVSQYPVLGRSSFVVRQICKGSVSELHRRPVIPLVLVLANDQRRTTNDAF